MVNRMSSYFPKGGHSVTETDLKIYPKASGHVAMFSQGCLFIILLPFSFDFIP